MGFREKVVGSALAVSSAVSGAQAPVARPLAAGPRPEPQHVVPADTIPPLPLVDGNYKVPLPAAPDDCTMGGDRPRKSFDLPPQEATASAVPFDLTGLPLSPLQLAMRHPEPCETPEHYFSVSQADVKFSIQKLIEALGSYLYENLVLAAYPDPFTRKPLIGPGVSLDLPPPNPDNPHLQPDANNPVQFMDTSSADLWTLAGLAPARLTNILSQFDERVERYGPREFNRMARIGEFTPDLDVRESDALTRVAILKSIHNAIAYVGEPRFKEMSASQQMGLVEMVYQMKIDDFANFLNKLGNNHLRTPRAESKYARTDGSSGDFWRDVQKILLQSKWARHQTTARAIRVVAKFDPHYDYEHPSLAEDRVRAMMGLHPVHPHPKTRVAKLDKPKERGHSQQMR